MALASEHVAETVLRKSEVISTTSGTPRLYFTASAFLLPLRAHRNQPLPLFQSLPSTCDLEPISATPSISVLAIS